MVRKVFGTTPSTVSIWATNKEVPDPCHIDSVCVTSMGVRHVSTVKLVHPTDKRKSMKERAGWRCEHDSVNQILEACYFEKVPEDMYYGEQKSLIVQLW